MLVGCVRLASILMQRKFLSKEKKILANMLVEGIIFLASFLEQGIFFYLW